MSVLSVLAQPLCCHRRWLSLEYGKDGSWLVDCQHQILHAQRLLTSNLEAIIASFLYLGKACQPSTQGIGAAPAFVMQLSAKSQDDRMLCRLKQQFLRISTLTSFALDLWCSCVILLQRQQMIDFLPYVASILLLQ